VRRRDISKVLLVAAAGTGVPAARGEQPITIDALRQALQARGAVHIPTGTYEVTGKLQTLLQNNISGDSRHDSILQPAGFADYVFEVGDGKRNPNAGRIERLRFYGAAGNRGCLHLNTSCHMWHLDDLLFSGGPCPALVVESCWDSNYTNIDILGHVTPGSDPAQTAAVIFRNGTANIYCRGLRIEGALSGGLYVDSGPNYVAMGKIDDGFGGPQAAAAITVTASGTLILEDFYLGGMLNQFHIDVAGALRLGKVALDGGSNHPAAIRDRRAWIHVNAELSPGSSTASYGPFIPALDLGGAEFHRAHPSVNTVTAAAVYSKIHPIRQVRSLDAAAPGTAGTDTRTVATSLRPTHTDTYKNSFLVDNSSGARRRIIRSLVGGELVLAGAEPVASGAAWSIEFCASHATPIQHENVRLDPGQTLFAVVAYPVSIAGPPTYVSAHADPAYGTTKFKIASSSPAPGQDLTGLFLVNDADGSAHYIEFGLDAQSCLGILYDRRAFLQPTDQFSVVAGHTAHIAGTAPSLSFMVAAAAGAKLVPDLSVSSEFEISVTCEAALAIDNPVASPGPATGQRITLTLTNTTSGQLGQVTWGSSYRLSPWTNPAPGHSRTIEFRFNGRNWVEIARTPADVPN
jgi:hypothetical protein